MISKLKRILLLIIREKIILLNSTPCDVVILDDSSPELMLACIPKKLKVQVLSLDNNLPFILPVSYFWFFLRHIFESKFITVTPFLAIIRVWEPKVIITYIDNSLIIGLIKYNFPKIL